MPEENVAMVTIKRDGEKRLKPRDGCTWFKEHKGDWNKLKFGWEVKVPKVILPQLANVVVVKKREKPKGGEG